MVMYNMNELRAAFSRSMCNIIYSMPTKDKGDLLLVTVFGYSKPGGSESCTVVEDTCQQQKQQHCENESDQDAAHHAVATHTAMMRSRRSPDVTAAAILLVSPACAMHPLALHITRVLRRVMPCAQTAQLMTAGLIR